MQPQPPDAPAIPHDNAANFFALECVALPWFVDNHLGFGDPVVEVSEWMKDQLRRSYEYERAEEWEAKRTTLSQAELLKTMA